MRVGFDITAALAQSAGVGRYTRELATALTTLPDGPDLLLLHNRPPNLQLDRLPAALRDLPRLDIPAGNRLWRLALLHPLHRRAWGLDQLRCDVYHGPDWIAPALSIPTVLTIHDLSILRYPQHHTLLNRWYARLALPRMVRRATAIIADSHATAQDVTDLLGVAPERITTIYPGVDQQHFAPRPPALARQRVQALLGFDGPYILALGTLEPRKNLTTLLYAYAQLDDDAPRLVLAGARGWQAEPIFALAEQQAIRARVTLPGFVPDALLPDLYAAAELFVYPSLFEGFGLPVAEAMACGAAVITSTTSSLPEVAGDAAILVAPTDVNGLAQAMRQVLGRPDLAADLRHRAPRQAAQFTWQQCARETLAVYWRVAG